MKSIQSTRQMALFVESPTVPHLNDLDETTRIEAMKLLAQLMLAVKACPNFRPAKGADDE